MIIELAGDLLSRTEQEITNHEAELEQLRQLRASLSAFIEQPGQVRSAPAPEGSPAPASSEAVRSGAASDPAPAAVPLPPGDGSPAIQPPGRGRGGGETQQRGGRPARRAAPSTSAPAAPVSLPHGIPPRVNCPDCDAKVRPGGLGPHRRFRHGHRAEKNPRSAAPLDLPPRLDQAVGE